MQECIGTKIIKKANIFCISRHYDYFCVSTNIAIITK